MDDTQFDALTRALRSRRTALGGLLGGLAALLGLAVPEETVAHDLARRCRTLPDSAKRQACLRRARAHTRKHRCQPKPPARFCRGRCTGTAVNNCGKRVRCPSCPAPRTCLSNGSCGLRCALVPDSCPPGCAGCSGPEVGNGFYCIPLGLSCEALPQTCVRTEDCQLGAFCFSQACPGPGGMENRCVPLCAA